MKTKPQPLNLEDKNHYPEDIFPEIADKEWKKIDKLLKKELGFPLDRVVANINRKMWNNMREWFNERIKFACEFYLKYKNKPKLFLKEHPKYKKELKHKMVGKYEPWVFFEYFLNFKIENLDFLLSGSKETCEKYLNYLNDLEAYNNLLFYFAFKDFLEEK